MIRRVLSFKNSAALWAVFPFFMLGGCSDANSVDSAKPSLPVAETWDWSAYLPMGFPEPFVPADNPMSEAKFQLGRHLFYDKRLSGNGTQACASCHFQHLAFSDGRSKAVGSTGELTARSAQSLVNVAYYASLTWANPALSSLERQAMVPLFVEDVGVEMGVNENNKTQVLARLQEDAYYVQAFPSVFPDYPQAINFDTVVKALAAFQRGLLSVNSKFDRVERGEELFSPTEQRGKQLFYGKAQCVQCHSGFHFSNHSFNANSHRVKRSYHNTGLYNLDGQGAYPEHQQGLIEVMPQKSNMGKFRVPTLRNIALTAPYMHDGSVATLEEVIAHYTAGGREISAGKLAGDGRENPFKDPLLNRIDLTAAEQQDLLAFLHTLTDPTIATNARFSNPFQTETTHLDFTSSKADFYE
ncbi:methanobactin export MATE transporter MbnM [Thiomicrorhabdus indica]|uniref:methanobactin export MATE transporter MbnM n=1 Tax=Thiomicrorhabdus indica TaxID=2267253 RepID=UPI00102D72D3|nr:methanobactin export MATE transporter MbnM [Thiomicrorhabdus indica]